MRDFLSEFVRGSDATCTMIVMDEGYMEQPRRYHLRPFRVLLAGAGTLVGVALLTTAVLAFTPVREFIPGYGTAQMERSARQNARQVAAMEDSLDEQRRYLRHLQSLMTGPVDSSFVARVQEAEMRGGEVADGAPPAASNAPSVAAEGRGVAPGARRGSPFAMLSHFSESLSAGSSPAIANPAGAGDPVRAARLDPVQFPVPLPAEGFVTRGFEAEGGHYAVDIAAEAGTPVHAIGDGYVVMADHTEEGGQAIAVQHGGGYLSLYKHNRKLLKKVGERVELREVIAESGNSGEITTGPHLHVELWRDGLAQDPAAYFIE